jgi:hypothetical protein
MAGKGYKVQVSDPISFGQPTGREEEVRTVSDEVVGLRGLRDRLNVEHLDSHVVRGDGRCLIDEVMHRNGEEGEDVHVHDRLGPIVVLGSW